MGSKLALRILAGPEVFGRHHRAAGTFALEVFVVLAQEAVIDPCDCVGELELEDLGKVLRAAVDDVSIVVRLFPEGASIAS